jgi:hypothetical protein
MNNSILSMLWLMFCLSGYSQTDNSRSYCGLEQVFVVSKGDTLNNIPPTLGTLFENYNFKYEIADTIPGKYAIGVITDQSTDPFSSSSTGFGIATDKGVYFYYAMHWPDSGLYEFYKSDSLIIDGIKNVASNYHWNDGYKMILAFEGDTIGFYTYKIYDVQTLDFLYERTIPISPVLMHKIHQRFFISGIQPDNNHAIAELDIKNDSLLYLIPIGPEAENPKEISYDQNGNVYVLSSPGESKTVVTKINTSTGNFHEKIILNNTGIIASHTIPNWTDGGDFVFQILFDSTNTGKEKNVLRYDKINEKFTYTKSFGEVIDVYHMDIAMGAYGGQENDMGIKWNGGTSDTIYYRDYYWTNSTFKAETQGYPFKFIPDVRCYGSVKEKNLEEIISVYPNPFTNEIQLKWESQEMPQSIHTELYSSTGKLVYQQQFNGLSSTIILNGISEGIYLLKVTTKGKVITKRVVKQ